MKKLFVALLAGTLIAVAGPAATAGADAPAYGAVGAAAVAEADLTLAAMLTFAIEDEYLERGEYRKILDKFGELRPFSHIIKGEEQHIAWLIPLLENHGVDVPADRGVQQARVPDTWAEALQAGVSAETGNIAMYERFLQQKLPYDVKIVFEHLVAASRNHLAAFQANRGGNKS